MAARRSDNEATVIDSLQRMLYGATAEEEGRGEGRSIFIVPEFLRRADLHRRPRPLPPRQTSPESHGATQTALPQEMVLPKAPFCLC